MYINPVYCGGCSLTWTVPYRHPGKTICDGCVKRLQALRQQDGVLVPREPTRTLRQAMRPFIECPQDELDLAWQAFITVYEKLAASGQDQPKAAAGQASPSMAPADSESGSAVGPASAAAPNAGRNAAVNLAESQAPAPSEPGDRGVAPTDSLSHPASADLLRGIALGIEAAAKACDESVESCQSSPSFGKAWGEYLRGACSEAASMAILIRSLNPSDIAASEKNPGAGQENKAAAVSSEADSITPSAIGACRIELQATLAQPAGAVKEDHPHQGYYQSQVPYDGVANREQYEAEAAHAELAVAVVEADWQAAKLRVIEKWPDAYCVTHYLVSEVWSGKGYKLGSGPDEPSAWLDAASRL